MKKFVMILIIYFVAVILAGLFLWPGNFDGLDSTQIVQIKFEDK